MIVWGFCQRALADVVGTSDGGSGPSTHGFLYRAGVMSEVPTPPGTPSWVSSYAQGITDAGDVVGGYSLGHNITYIHTHGFSMDIPTPSGVEAYAFAINNAWQMAGLKNDNTIGVGHAARFNRGVWEDLGTLGAEAFGFAINEVGEVAGESYTNFGTRAFVYRNGAMADLGSLPGLPEAGARGINKAGQIVGYSSLVGPPVSKQRAFIHSGGQMFGLMDMIDPADPLKPYVVLEYAAAINDSGWIAAGGIDSRTGQGRVFLLRPM